MGFLLQLLAATLNGSLKCSCNHLTSFGGSLLVKPNPIDFDKVLVEFKKLDETGNVAVIVTVMVAFMVYFLVLFVARRADKRDAARVSFYLKFCCFSDGYNSHTREEIKLYV